MDGLRTLNGWLKRPLYDYQLEAIAHFQKRGGYVLADEMGLGKTLSAIGCIVAGKCTKSLVVCPANVKYQWQKEIEKSLNKALQIFVCEGRSPKRTDEYYLKCADIVIINYQILQDWQTIIRMHHWDLMVLDEAQKIKKSKSICTHAAKSIRKQVDNVLCLTGTPLTDRNSDLWNVVSIADPTVFPSEFRFLKRYCIKEGLYGGMTSGSINTQELHGILKDTGVMLRRRKVDVFKELPKVIHSVIPIKANMTELNRIRNEAVSMTRNSKEIGRGLDMVQFRKCMEQYRQEAIRLKLPHVIAWIKDFLESSNQKLMVAVVHRDKCGRLLYDHFGSKIAVIMDGQLTSKQKEATKERFINDPDCRLLIGNILSTGTGTDGLQHVCSNLLYAELDWSPANMSQCTSRLDRTGQKEPVTVTYMTVMGSIEDQLARTLDKKSKILASVLDNRTVDDTELLTYMIQNGITEEEADWL